MKIIVVYSKTVEELEIRKARWQVLKQENGVEYVKLTFEPVYEVDKNKIYIFGKNLSNVLRLNFIDSDKIKLVLGKTEELELWRKLKFWEVEEVIRVE